MTRYERQQVPADGGFDVDGRVVSVLETHSNTIEILVELPDEQTATPTTFGDSEGVRDKQTFFCGAEKDGGGACGREVDEPYDTCWQHPDDEQS